MSSAPPNSGRTDDLAIVHGLRVVGDAPERFDDRAAAIDTLHVSAWIALEESEERFQLATEGAGAGVWDHDFTTLKFVWSERHCAMLGFPADVEPSFELWRSLVDPDDLEGALAEFSRARDSKTQFRACYRIRRADTGEERWLEDAGRYFYGDGDKALRCAGVIVDITDKKRAEEALQNSERELADFFETASIGLHWVGADGKILPANRAELEMMGYAAEEYIGRHIAEFHADAPVIEDILQRLTCGQALHDYPARLRRKDGAIRDVQINSSVRFENGEFLHTRCFTTDVTEKKRAEDALRAIREDLAAELAATKLLQAISCELVREDDVDALYEKILHAATVVMRSDFASLQMLYPKRGEGGELRLLGQRGFPEEATKFWEWVRADSESTCGVALKTGCRSIATDVATCAFMAGSEDQRTYLQSGILAVQSTPLFSRDGEIVGMISTHWKKPHRPTERELSMFDVLARQAADLIERAAAEAKIEANRRSYAELIERSPFGVYVVDSDFRIAHANAEARDGAFVNVRPMIGRDFSEAVRILWPEDVAAMVIAAFRGTLETGEPYFSNDYRFPRADVDAVEAYEWELHRTTLPDGRYAVICYYYDSSKLRDTEASLRDAQLRQKLLLDELNHRVKNTLATVQSIAMMTLRNADSQAAAGADFTARLVSLSNAHNILTRESWEGADLDDVVRSALSPYSDEKRARFRLEGPPLRLRPRSALALSLALHELATNAIKHGSLSEGDGLVDIVWSAADGRFRFYWTESGGPKVAPPQRKGFGSRLLREGIASDLGGEAELRFEPDGVVCKISAPLEEIAGRT